MGVVTKEIDNKNKERNPTKAASKTTEKNSQTENDK